WLNSRVLHRQELPAAQSRIFDRFVPLFQAIEGKHPSSGLSLIAIGRKPPIADVAAPSPELAMAEVPA
ncbi:MAG: hypothetical protein ACXV5L_05390, partial [Thermoanaerobaculia bacterium]